MLLLTFLISLSFLTEVLTVHPTHGHAVDVVCGVQAEVVVYHVAVNYCLVKVKFSSQFLLLDCACVNMRSVLDKTRKRGIWMTQCTVICLNRTSPQKVVFV